MDMPLMILPIAFSRTPKCILRPDWFPELKSPPPLRVVIVDGERSAEPPIKLGRTPATAFITLPDMLLVAMLPSSGLNRDNTESQSFGSFPPTACSNLTAKSGYDFL